MEIKTEAEMKESEYIKIDRNLNPKKEQQKASALTIGGNGAGNHSDMDLFCVAMRGRYSDNPSDRSQGITSYLTPRRNELGKQIRKQYEAGIVLEPRKNMQQLEPRFDGKTNTLTTVEKDNLIMEANSPGRIGGITVTDRGIRFHQEDKRKSGIGELGTVLQMNKNTEFGHQPRQQNRFYSEKGISPTLQQSHAAQSPNVFRNCRIRRLTPTECARLQTVPVWYQWKGRFEDGTERETSDTQIYRMLGNGWCVEVIKHIFSFLPKEWMQLENQDR